MTLKEALRILQAEIEFEKREAERAKLRAWVLAESQRYSDQLEVERFLKSL